MRHEALWLQKPTTNISKEEKAALRKLRKNTSIKILPPNKGIARVVMNLEGYETKVEEILKKGNYQKDPTTMEGRIFRALKEHAST